MIATIGITPTRAETGFGYLELAAPPAPARSPPVARFVEKPDRATAERYVASGRYLWNAGIFCASARRLLAELDAHLPATAARGARDRARAGARAGAVSDAAVDLDRPRGDGEGDRRRDRARARSAGTTSARGPRCPRCAASTRTGNTVVGDGARASMARGNVVVTDDDTLIATVGVSDLVVVKSGRRDPRRSARTRRRTSAR